MFESTSGDGVKNVFLSAGAALSKTKSLFFSKPRPDSS